jgi:hypothetical protein
VQQQQPQQVKASTVQHLLQLFQYASSSSSSSAAGVLAQQLSQPAVVAAMGSALCSILKVAAAFSEQPDATEAARDSATAQAAAAAAALDSYQEDYARHDAGLLSTLCQLSRAVLLAVQQACEPTAGPGAAGTKQQAAASAIFLLLLICRGLISVGMMIDSKAAAAGGGAAVAGDKEALNFKLTALQQVFAAFSDVRAALKVCMQCQAAGLLAGAADDDGAAAGIGFDSSSSSSGITRDRASSAADNTSDSSSSSSSGSSKQRVRWQYLLRLHESRKLMSALAAFDSTWDLERFPGFQNMICAAAVNEVLLAEASADDDSASNPCDPWPELIESSTHRFCTDTLGLWRTLLAVAPLPVVCNNVSCRQLQGPSEAAAAKYVCAGCGCSYCSTACQAAGWRGHKKACRRMVACRMKVELR